MKPSSAFALTCRLVRAAAPSLTKALRGQGVVIENLPGAGGISTDQKEISK